jgi:uncharacterized protein YaaN involved in tellurite resistance
MSNDGRHTDLATADVEVTPTTTASTAPPEAMSADEVAEVRRHAGELVRSVRESTGSRQLGALDEVGKIGLTSQRNAGRQLELVKARLSTLFDEGGASKEVASDLVELRLALDKINPSTERQRIGTRLLGAVPFLRHSALVRSLKKIALRYEPVSKQIVVIETRLRSGRTMLTRDNVELRQLYEDVESQQDAVQRQIFFGHVLLDELQALAGEVHDGREQDRIQTAVHDVAVRLQDLHTMQEVHVQYFVSIEITRDNNQRLCQAVDRTLSLATNVVTIGLALQAALARQKEVKEATERTRQFLGEVITQNAAAIRRQTEEIGDLYNEPVIAMDKLAQAHHDLISALDTASQLREQGVVTARRNIAELTQLTRDLATHVEGLEPEQGRRQ